MNVVERFRFAAFALSPVGRQLAASVRPAGSPRQDHVALLCVGLRPVERQQRVAWRDASHLCCPLSATEV